MCLIVNEKTTAFYKNKKGIFKAYKLIKIIDNSLYSPYRYCPIILDNSYMFETESSRSAVIYDEGYPHLKPICLEGIHCFVTKTTAEKNMRKLWMPGTYKVMTVYINKYDIIAAGHTSGRAASLNCRRIFFDKYEVNSILNKGL